MKLFHKKSYFTNNGVPQEYTLANIPKNLGTGFPPVQLMLSPSLPFGEKGLSLRSLTLLTDGFRGEGSYRGDKVLSS